MPLSKIQTSNGRRNILYNGQMQVAQRGTTFDTLTTGNFCTDRWKIAFAGLDGNVDADQTTTVPSGQGFSNSLQIHMDASETSLDAADQINVHQRLEGFDLQHLLKGTSNAKKTVLSFWVRSSVASTYTLELYDNDNSRSIGKTYTINTADTWERKEIVFDGDTTGTLGNDNARSMDVRWWIDAGSSYTSGTLDTSWASVTTANRVSQTTGWLESTSPEFYITGCQWEVGEESSEFDFRRFSDELRDCQRYYTKSWSYENAVSTNPGVITAACVGNVNRAFGSVFWPVEMRSAPTVTWYSGSNATSGKWRNGSQGTDINPPSAVAGIGTKGYGFVLSSGISGVTDTLQGHYEAESEL